VELAPWLAREVAAPSWGVVVAYYTALVAALVAPSVRRAAALTAAVFGIAIAFGPHYGSRDGVSRAPRGSLRLVFLDVGQGDATLLVLPDGRAMLIDAGGLPAAPLRHSEDGPAFDIGDRVVAPALRAFGVRRLDTLVLTHGDPDHIGGAAALIRSFRPRAVWEGVPIPPHAPLEALREQSAAAGAEWRIVQAADRLSIAGVEIVALHPPPPEWERQRVRNDDSVVLMIRYGAVSVILPGDIGREGEIAVLRRIESMPLVVLKAPHHGSATSSTPELLSALTPRAVIVSAGRDNRFGHPAPVVIARYRAIGAAIFSTASDGAVILESDGREVQISGWTSGKSVSLKSR
jgi:competence protein ComEC